MEWFKNLLGANSGRIKSFEEATADINPKDYRSIGVKSIEVSRIVGSVDRAHELNAKFQYRNRAMTSRYRQISKLMQEGRPMTPIKVIKVERVPGEPEYYVVDGHHRVAEAIAQGLPDINAQITELIIPANAQDNVEETNP